MKASTRSYYVDIVTRAARRVYDSLDAAIDLGALAREAALAPLHFHRIFRGMLGETPLELHRRLRLERAAHTLASSDTAVTTIAFAAGYETHESFTRAFRKAFAMSPSEFRDDQARARSACERPRSCELAARSGIHIGRELVIVHPESTMHVEIENLPALRLATVAHIGPYDQISEAFARLGSIAGPAGLIGRGCQMLALYHDDPESTAPAELRSDAALSIASDARLPDGLAETALPAGRYAKTVHKGPYTGLGDAWSQLMGTWLPASGHRLGAGATFEIYRNTPQTAAPEELETELYIPLA